MRVVCFFFVITVGLLLETSIFAQAPTRTKIAFVSVDRNPAGIRQSSLHLMNPDGSDVVTLISPPGGIHQLAWEPTTARILFGTDREGVHDIYVMDLDGTDVKPMFRQRRYRREPTWSPSGTWIAYTSPSTKGTWSIYIGSADDGHPGIPVARTGRNGGQPAWSPDGTEIAFVVASPGSREIYLLNLEIKTRKTETGTVTEIGTLERLLPNQRAWMRHPTWSPDSQKIAFTWAPGASGTGIYLVNRDGTGLQQITQPDRWRILSLTWDPTGEALVYARDTENNPQLFRVDLNDLPIQQLTHEASHPEALWLVPSGVVPVEPSAASFSTTWGHIKRQD